MSGSVSWSWSLTIVSGGLPGVPVGDLLGRASYRRPEVPAGVVGHRDQPDLDDAVGDAEQRGSLVLVRQMHGGEHRAQPRARSASCKLQTAGRIEPNMVATSKMSDSDGDLRTQGITCTGTSWSRSARYIPESMIRAI